MAPAVPRPNRRPIDRSIVEAWTTAIADGRPDKIRSVFKTFGASGPEIVWSPGTDRLIAAPLRFLMRYWSDLAGANGLPSGRLVDPLAMRPALGHVCLLDVVGDGEDFRYRVYGTVVAELSGFDMTGKLISVFPATAFIVEFYVAAYAAVTQRREPLLTIHRPPATQHTSAWHRLVLPLVDDKGAVNRILLGVICVDLQGRPIAAEP